MSDKRTISIQQSIWIRSGLTDQQAIFRSIRSALIERGITVLTLNGAKDTAGLERIRKAVWNSPAHVVLDGMTPGELKVLRPVFRDRRRFSMALVDWWTSDYWFTKNADFLIFRNYNGIAVRRKLGKFSSGRPPPLFFAPESTVPFELASTVLRLPALAAAPLINMWKERQRRLEQFKPEQLLYFPFTIAEEHVPLRSEEPRFDFSNISSTGGYWLMRDPHVSAWLNFGNLYYDRFRLTNLVLHFENKPFKIFDLRRSVRLDWDAYCRVIGQTRFAIATGGLHQNSVAKYAEFACLGVPMLGELIPYEFPWLEKCLFPVDTLGISAAELKPLLEQAMQRYPVLKENCLALRQELLRLYNAHRIIDMLQDQIDGKPIPPGYLRAEALASDVQGASKKAA